MATSFTMNLEVLALEIAVTHINMMSDSNTYFDTVAELEISDETAFINNIKNGWITVSMLSNYVESIINTILRDCVNCDSDGLMKSNMSDKLDILYLYYKADISVLKKEHNWETFKKLIKIRNELTHYKRNHIGAIGYGYGIPISWRKPFEDVGEYFTRSKMSKVKDEILQFCNKIAGDFGLVINLQARLFDDMEDSVPFVCKSI